MKKFIYLFVLAATLFSCDQYNESNFPGADADEISNVDDSLAYTLTEDDYQLVSSDLTTYLTDEYPDSVAIPTVLDSEYPYLDDGSVAYVTFNYYTGENVAYQDSINNWAADDAYQLTSDDYDDMGFKYDNFSSSNAPDDYLPDFLTDKYEDEGDGFSVLITYKYYASSTTSNVVAKYTKEISLTADETYELESSDYSDMGLSYSDFSYSSPADNYLPAWLKTKYPNATDGEVVAITYAYYSNSTTTDETAYYEYDADTDTWSEVSAVNWVENGSVTIDSDVTPYTLTSDDYDAMGVSSFNTSVTTDEYLPTFLEQNYPYAQVGDKVALLYQYEGDDTQIEATEYTLNDTAWVATGYSTTTTEQFIKSDGEWAIETAVLYTMVKGSDTGDDYQMIVDYVGDNYGSSYLGSLYDGVYESETYYGVNSYYGEFRINSSYWNTDMFDSWDDAVVNAIGNVFLPQKYPDAEEGTKYIITFAGYVSSMVDYTITFKCTAAGTTPTFELVDGPTEE